MTQEGLAKNYLGSTVPFGLAKIGNRVHSNSVDWPEFVMTVGPKFVSGIVHLLDGQTVHSSREFALDHMSKGLSEE
jgi:hypothetical protein